MVAAQMYGTIASDFKDMDKDTPKDYLAVQLDSGKWGEIDEEDTWDW